MAGETIVDVNRFDPVPLIEVGDEVKGGLEGPSNKQAIALANRTLHLKEEGDNLKQKVDALDANTVGADGKGTAEQLMDDHLKEADPHSQYVKLAGANLPGGILLLDANGKIPEQFMEIFKSSYLVKADKAERLAVPTSPDLTIVAQVDDSTLYYLNGGVDPSVESNWYKGQSATVVGVGKVFNRTGDVTAQDGDYNANQITETPERVFLSPAEKQSFALKQDKLISGISIKTIHGVTILGGGDFKLTYDQVGADKQGAGTDAVAVHEAKADPHDQYINETRGDARYVPIVQGNKPLGFLQLDAAGKVPAGVIDVLQARQLVVQDDAERLAVSRHNNLTIVAQLNGPGEDDDRMYYLNADMDPSVDSNWYKGQSAVLQGVPSIFGRTGAVVAQAGDYNADQITETNDRKFVTPAEKTGWGGKQDKLTSGSNIKTFFGQTLLGAGNLAPTPDQMGVAAKLHNHTVSEISDWKTETQKLITNSYEAGSGISIGQNPVNGKTIISSTGGGSGGGRDYVIVDRVGATAGQSHAFTLGVRDSFNLDSFALKEEAGAQNQVYVADEFNATSSPNYTMTDGVVLDGLIKANTNSVFQTVADGSFFSTPIPSGADGITITGSTDSIVPAMTSNTAPAGYTASASSNYSASYPAYVAFDQKNTGGTGGDAWVGAAGAIPTVDSPQWVQIDMPFAQAISRYALTNRMSGEINSPKTWDLLGSNDGGATWSVVHSVVNDTNNNSGAVRNFTIPTTTPAYKTYRLNVTEMAKSTAGGYITIRELALFPQSFFMLENEGKWYNVVDDTLVEVPAPTQGSDFVANGFTQTNKLSKQKLAGLNKLKIATPFATVGKLSLTPPRQIAFKTTPLNGLGWEKINSMTVTATQTGSGIVRVALTHDGSEYFVLTNGVWTSIGPLAADDASTDTILASGMTPAEVTAITTAQWADFYSATNGAPDYIGYAFGFSVVDGAVDTAGVDRLLLNVNNTPSWKVQTPAEVEVRWRGDTVTFKTVTAGNYKLVYQLPS